MCCVQSQFHCLAKAASVFIFFGNKKLVRLRQDVRFTVWCMSNITFPSLWRAPNKSSKLSRDHKYTWPFNWRFAIQMEASPQTVCLHSVLKTYTCRIQQLHQAWANLTALCSSSVRSIILATTLRSLALSKKTQSSQPRVPLLLASSTIPAWLHTTCADELRCYQE